MLDEAIKDSRPLDFESLVDRELSVEDRGKSCRVIIDPDLYKRLATIVFEYNTNLRAVSFVGNNHFFSELETLQIKNRFQEFDNIRHLQYIQNYNYEIVEGLISQNRSGSNGRNN